MKREFTSVITAMLLIVVAGQAGAYPPLKSLL